MIDLAFGESPAGALKMAKAMKNGERLVGATAVIGGTEEQRREAIKPRYWAGLTMEGSAADVAALTLAFDIGDISNLDTGIDKRKQALDSLFGDFPGVTDEIWKTNLQTLTRLNEARAATEPVRMWVGGGDPAELCGMYFVCGLLANAPAKLSVVSIPQEVEKENCIVSYHSTGEIPPEEFGAFTQYEKPISELQHRVYANRWSDLARENAPLRTIVNGTLMGVPEDFYDFALRANMPDGEFKVAHLIGKTLNMTPGVGDRWLYLRVRSMIQSGELVEVSKPDDHPYSGVIRRSNS